eukprot:9676440-Heterocapsa_arctica.AAC.1
MGAVAEVVAAYVALRVEPRARSHHLAHVALRAPGRFFADERLFMRLLRVEEWAVMRLVGPVERVVVAD